MRNASVFRIGGRALIVGAVLLGIGMVLHPAQPESLKAASALSTGAWVRWVLSHWVLVLGLTACVGGWIALGRNFAQTTQEGWSVLALSAAALGTAGLLAVYAPQATAYPMLLDLYRAGGKQVATEHAFIAINATTSSLFIMANMLLWLGAGVFGFAMLRESRWPRELAFSGMGVAVVQMMGGFLLIDQPSIHRIMLLLGYAWLAYAGVCLARNGSPVAAAAASRAAGEPHHAPSPPPSWRELVHR